jgi:cyclic pyranopterin phosphate synthase
MRGAQATDADIASAIGHIWHGRDDRYSELRASMPADSASDGSSSARRVEMSYIGG